MKSTMNKIMMMIVISLSSLMVQAAEKTVFTVNGMVCAFCAQGIEKKIRKMPETQAVKVDLEAKTVVVEARPGMTVPVDKVILEIKDAGYDVTGTTVVPDSIKALQNKAEIHHE